MSSTMITVIVGSVVTALAFALMLGYANFKDNKGRSRKTSKETSVKETNTSNKNKTKTEREEIEDAIGIESIQNNVVIGKDGYMSIVLEYSTPDIPSLTDDEQDAYEARLRQAVVTIKASIKTIEMASKITTVKANINILSAVQRAILTPEATEYAKKLAEALNDKQFDRQEVEKKKYFVLGAKGSTEEETIGILKKLAETNISNLNRARVETKLLTTTELIELNNELINHGTRLNVETAENTGIFELFSSGGH